jgi:alpha-D-ribose 1-methylphosphonate 5-triphosphate synthase subunit PhnL
LSENKEQYQLDEGAVERSAISLYLQDTERQVIQHLIEYAKNNNVEVVSIIHDEILYSGLYGHHIPCRGHGAPVRLLVA